MINLIPKEEKKKIVMDFYRRLVVLFLLMASFSVLVALLAMVPSYLLSKEKDSISNTKLEAQKQEPLPLLGEQSLSEIKDINSKLDLVDRAEKNKFLISEKIINTVLSKKTPNIKIKQIVYENDTVGGKKVSIVGVASSREILLSFKQALEDDPTFKNVDLPISNFIKISNIEFNLSLTPS